MIAGTKRATFKTHREALDAWAVKELVGHSVADRKLVSRSPSDRLPEDQFGLYAVTARFQQRRTHMRIALVTMLCTLGLAASGGRADDKVDIEKELKKYQGSWNFASVVTGGMEQPIDNYKGMTVTFEGDKFTVKNGDEVVMVGKQRLDPSKSPKAVDVTVLEGLNKGSVLLGIYEISGDTLKVCFDSEGKKRPTEFKSAPGSATFVNVHKRVKK